MRVAVVGATGAVGSTMLGVMRERSFPADEVVPFASERSAGRSIDWGDTNLTVQPLADESIQGFDIALFSAGSAVSAEWAPRFADAGAVVVDNSSQWRMHEDVPLVVSEVNPEALDGHKGIVANPNCTTMQTVVALGPILRRGGHRAAWSCRRYQAVSGTGQKAVEELHDQAEARDRGQGDAGAGGLPAPDRLQRAPAGRDLQGRRRLHDRGAQVHARDEQDPRPRRHRGVRHLRARARVTRGTRCRRTCRPASRSRRTTAATCSPRRPASPWSTTPRNGLYPTALDAAGRDDVLVGRIRRDPSHERCLNLWIVGDNLRKGAATNAVQVAELLNVRGLLRAARAA